MNNRGQSLVLFVLLIPLVLMILYAVYEIGRMTLLKHELDNINAIALDYGINKINDENIDLEIKELIEKNKNDIDQIDIRILDDKMYIVLEDSLSKRTYLFKNIFIVKSSYVGYIDNDKKIIERDR